jgi:hypothetical protein
MKQILFLLATCLTLNSCSNDTSTNSISMKYELTSTSPFTNINSVGGTLPAVTVAYTNETGQRQQEQLQISGTSWSKTINLTTSQRPVAVAMEANGNTQTNSGSVTLKVYVNGSLRGTHVVNIGQSSFQNYGMFIGGYIGGILID